MDDVLGADQALQAVLGHGDFGGFDNEAIDFRHLEDYINGEDENNIYFSESLVGTDVKNPEPPLIANGIKPSTNLNHSQIQPPQVSQSSSQLLYNLVPNLPYKNTPLGNGYSHPHHLPDSPPDSGSEPPYSPPNDEHKPNAAGAGNLPELLLPPMPGRKQLLSYNNTQPLNHLPDLQILSHQHISSLQPPSVSQQTMQSSSQAMGTTQQSNNQTLSGSVLHQQKPQNPLQPLNTTDVTGGSVMSPLPPTVFGNLTSIPAYPGSKKRKLESPNGASTVNSDMLNGLMNIKQEPGSASVVLPPPPSSQRHCVSPDQGSNQSVSLAAVDDDLAFDFSSDSAAFVDSAYQCIRFQHFQPSSWHIMCDSNLKELSPNYRVDADKGFNFSNADDAFVCQKKNHFQVTVHAQVAGEPHFVRTPEGLKKIDAFFIHFYGVKVESQSQTIKVEQSQSDRSKKPFHPVLVEFSREQLIKLTVGRLHFSETTSNNMRKKGKPNPDQRYFYLVVGLHAHCGENNYAIVSQCSERIIVRASNPGQFESEVELSWQKGHTSESIFHAGKVGINTDRPDEPLVVHGNIKVTGHIIQPSDARAKEDIQEVDTKEQLRNLQQLRIVHYKYNQQFAQHAGLADDERSDTGVIAQEVQKVIPDAVKAAGDIVLPSGERIDNFLVVNKDRIFIENIGAVKELCKVTDNLENRIDELERMNNKLARLKRIDSMKSTSSGSTISSLPNRTSTKRPLRRRHHRLNDQGLCPSKFVQGTIIVLILVMALCLIAMATLYILEWQKRQFPQNSLSNQDLNKIQSNFTQNVSTDTGSSLYSSTLSSIRLGGLVNSSATKTPSVIHATSSSFTVRVQGKRDPIGIPAHCIGSKAQINNCTSFCCDDPEAVGARKPVASIVPTTTMQTSTISPSSTRRILTKNVTSIIIPSGAGSRNIPQLIWGADTTNITHNAAVSIVTSYPQRPGNTRSYAFPTEGSTYDINENENKLPISETETDAREYQYPTVVRWHNKSHPFLKFKNSSDKPVRQKRQSNVQPSQRVSARNSQSVVNKSNISFVGKVHSIKILEFNHTITRGYCSNCRDGNYTYLIPVSRYMTEPRLTLEFRFLSASSDVFVDYCQTGNKITECSSMYSRDTPDAVVDSDGLTNERKTQELTPSWVLPIGMFEESSYKFRVTNIPNHTAACTADAGSANMTFVEYNFVFFRSCND